MSSRDCRFIESCGECIQNIDPPCSWCEDVVSAVKLLDGINSTISHFNNNNNHPHHHHEYYSIAQK